MKRFLLILDCCLLAVVSKAQLRWDGEAGDGNWATAINWVGNVLPGVTDDVLLDNSALSGNYTVSLSAGNSSITVNSLTISPSISNIITVINPSNNISSTAFLATGPGDALVLNRGAVFRNSSGASAGTPVSVTGTNFFRINNGGKYIHNTERGHTNELVARLSTTAGTEDGIFEFDVPSTAAYTISASGRTYGHLVFSASAAGSTKTYTASGISAFTINGDLEINASATVSYGANTNTILINKNCIIHNGAVFNISNGSNNATVSLKGNLDNQGLITESGSSTGSKLELSGSVSQDIHSPGNLLQSITFTVNNTAGVTLLSPLTLPYHLQLLNGKIKTSSMNLLNLADNAGWSGGSATSFVEGPMKKTGDENFDFPVGVGAIFSPIGISGAGGNTGDEFIAEYKRANPQSTPGLGNSWTDPIDHISYVEYWTVLRNAGLSDKTITLTVSASSFAKIPGSLLVAGFEAGQWQSKGGVNFIAGPASPPNITGRFTSVMPVNQFAAFTIASTDDEFLNPLPLKWIAFDIMTRDKVNIMYWRIGGCCDDASSFEIEKAASDHRYHRIARLMANAGDSRYVFTDSTRSGEGINYYRVKLINKDGSISYSPTRSVEATLAASQPFLVPTIVNDQCRLNIYSATDQQLELLVLDVSGRMVRRMRRQVTNGINNIPLSLSELLAGTYFLRIIMKDKSLPAIPFIRR